MPKKEKSSLSKKEGETFAKKQRMIKAYKNFVKQEEEKHSRKVSTNTADF